MHRIVIKVILIFFSKPCIYKLAMLKRCQASVIAGIVLNKGKRTGQKAHNL